MTDSWADAPIEGLSDDLLDRRRFAQMVADAIEATPPGADSAVFGLVGSWGSGKSSIVNIVRQMLPEWSIQTFAPWVANDPVSLQLEFLNALDSAVGGATKSKKIRSAVDKYSRWVIPMLGAVPFAGSAISQSAGQITEDVLSIPPWDKAFEKTANKLRHLGQRVLIVCDDIDRLDGAELLQFLKVVRLLGRFPNVHYLVAYDSETVEDMLDSQGVTGRRSSFMEKIVQHPFEIPTIGFQKRFDLAVETLLDVADKLALRFDSSDYERLGSLASALGRGLLTPRGQFRYRNDLSVFAPLARVGQETDFLDFAALSFLRLNYHEVFSALPAWRSDLREGMKTGRDKPDSPKTTRADWIERIERVSRRKSNPAVPLEILGFLFPNMNPSASSGDHPQAIADDAYFQRYFNLEIADDDVSDELTKEAVFSLTGETALRDGAEGYLARKVDDGRPAVARLAIEKARLVRREMSITRKPVAMIEFLDARLKALTAKNTDNVDSQKGLLKLWLAIEVKDAYAEGALNLQDLIDRYPESDLISLVREAFYAGRESDPAASKLTGDLSAHYLSTLRTAQLGDNLPFDRVRDRLSLVSMQNEGAASGIFESQLKERPELFADLVASLAYVERWVGKGVRQELAFDRALWFSILEPDTLRRLVPTLPESKSLKDIDGEDLSSDNRRKYAFAMSRELIKQLPDES